MDEFLPWLSGSDLRSIGESDRIVEAVTSQRAFDGLMVYVFHERATAMRAIDAIEKITRSKPVFLQPHKADLLALADGKPEIEMKWHLALLLPRLPLDADEVQHVVALLQQWLTDRRESRIVRVNSLQGLYELTQNGSLEKKDFEAVTDYVKTQNIPSLQARLRNMEKN